MQRSETRPAPRTATSKIKRFQRDLPKFCKAVVRIVNRQQVLTPLELNASQLYVHRKISEQMRETGKVRAIVLKARQTGVSTYVAARFYRRATLWQNQNCVIIADNRKRGGTIFSIYDLMYRQAPEELKPIKRWATKATHLWFDNASGTGLNSRIQVETAKDTDAGRGSTIHALHATEVAFWENAEDTWIGLAQAVPASGSEVVIESTANGVGNFFHQVWEDAVAGRSGYIPIFLPWFIDPEYTEVVTVEREKDILATLSAWEKRALYEGIEWEGEHYRLTPGQLSWRRTTIADNHRGDERSFRQEFPAEAREAFLVSGNAFFDTDALERYRESSQPPIERSNLVWAGDAIAPIRSEFGNLRIWNRPSNVGHYVISADTATGKQVSPREHTFSDAGRERGGKDYCSADVFDIKSRSFVAQLHGHMVPEVFAEQLRMLGMFYSNQRPGAGPDERRTPALIAVEANHSSGESVLRMLKDEYGYPRLHYHRVINRRTNKVTEVLGWRTTVENRQQMLDDFAQALRENSIHLPNADTIRECLTFVRGGFGEDAKPQAMEGCHDDRVISAAIAIQLARETRPPTSQKLPEMQFGTSPTGFTSY